LGCGCGKAGACHTITLHFSPSPSKDAGKV